MSFDIKVNGFEQDGDNVLYKLRITDLITMDSREIRVRYSQLLEVHTALQNENYNSILPLFPKKDSLKQVFGKDSEMAKQRELLIGQYFHDLLKNPPPLQRPLFEFLREGVDILRYQQMHLQIYNKSEYMKGLQFEKVLNKGVFSKTSLLKSNNRRIILHKFYVVGQEAETLCKLYAKTHLGLNDFSTISRVLSVFFIKQKSGLMDSIIGTIKPPKGSKKKPFQYLYPMHMNKLETYKIFSLEEYEGISLEEVIKQKQLKNERFTFDEILNIAQRVLQGLQYLHRRNITPNRITSHCILLQNDQVKLSGINEPSDKYKDKFMLEGHANRSDREFDLVYYPPEKQNNSYSCNPFKVDAWQFGVSLLKACNIARNAEVSGIQYDQMLLLRLIEQSQLNYGDVISSLLDCSLKLNPLNRSDIKELYFMAMQTSILPFDYKYLNQQKPSILRKTINNVSDINLLMDQLQKQPQGSRVNIKVILQDNNIEHELSKLFTYLGEYCDVTEVNIILNRYTNSLGSLIINLHSLKHLCILYLDIKHMILCNDDCIELMKYLNTQTSLHKLFIDVSYVKHPMECPNEIFIEQIQAIKTIKTRVYNNQ